MSEKTIKYTVSIYTENSVGLLNRISAIFQKRHINIESFNSSITEIEDVQRWTILVHTSEILIKKIVGQINKQIEVIKSYYIQMRKQSIRSHVYLKLNPHYCLMIEKFKI